MRSLLFAGAIAASAAIGGSAQASVHTLQFTITNNTADAWREVIFEIREPRGVQFDPQQYALVQFTTDLNRHDTTKRPVDISVEEETGKMIRFDYSRFQPLSQQDGPVNFTLVINNPSGMDFRVGYRKVLVPTPGAAALLAGAVGFASVRRRRSA